MFIPLDYYRILGLPIQATTEQLQQAHRDRVQQLPRREYSDVAINARTEVLDKAFAVLSDLEQRQVYDAAFLSKTYEYEPEIGTPVNGATAEVVSTIADPATASIEIEASQLVGALLLLQELGEYELVLRLGRPFLIGGSATLKDGKYGSPALVYPDIVLTVALACLELGREQWQQGQYENAAEALDTGQRLLLREGLFAGIRGEVQADLYKLRPYQILELLSQANGEIERRHQGLRLLQAMLDERGGIDGTGDDQSGLGVDDFLRFIQQLRGYMTAAEQQVMFEEEARRPSPVANYLAVYALLARGFAEHEPGLIWRSHQLLQQLSTQQDVHLEQAVCLLLLGQPETASRSLEFSQELEPIAFIREHSQAAPDLLPGLCLYTERWLQDEVFPHFSDLANQQVSLKDYFADLRVQEYLETLTTESAAAVSPPATSTPSENLATPAKVEADATHPEAQGYSSNSSNDADALIAAARARIAAGVGASAYAGSSAAKHVAPNQVATVSTAERVTPLRGRAGSSADAAVKDSRSGSAAVSDTGRATRIDEDLGRVMRRVNRPNASKQNDYLRWLLPLGVATTLLATGFAVTWLWRTWQSTQLTQSRAAQPAQVVQPKPLSTPAVAAADPATLEKVSAQRVVETWLAAKAVALGPDHTTEKLEQILTGKMLAYWQRSAKEAKKSGWHKEFEHKVAIADVQQSATNPNQARVIADVSEATEFFENDKRKRSKTENLRVRYDLVRKDSKWQIQDWKVVR